MRLVGYLIEDGKPVPLFTMTPDEVSALGRLRFPVVGTPVPLDKDAWRGQMRERILFLEREFSLPARVTNQLIRSLHYEKDWTWEGIWGWGKIDGPWSFDAGQVAAAVAVATVMDAAGCAWAAPA